MVAKTWQLNSRSTSPQLKHKSLDVKLKSHFVKTALTSTANRKSCGLQFAVYVKLKLSNVKNYPINTFSNTNYDAARAGSVRYKTKWR